MIRVAKAVFYKEIREVFRDKRTLLLALVLPMFFYPVLVSVSLLSSEPQDKENVEMQRVGIGAVASMPKVEGIEWVQRGKVRESGDLVFLQRQSKGDFLLNYIPSFAGEKQKEEVLRLLEKHKEQIVLQQFKEQGLAANLLEPFRVEVKKTVGARGEIALKYGGAAAYFVIFLAFTGCMSVAVDAGAGERERGTLEAMMTTSASLLGVGAGKLCFVVLMGLLSVISTVLGLCLVVLTVPELRMFLAEMLDWRTGLQLTLLLSSIVVLFGAILYGVSLLAKSTREAHLRASLLMMLVAVSLIVAGSEQVAGSVWALFTPIMNVSVAVAAALGGSLTWVACGIVVMSSLSLSLLMLWLLSVKLKRHPERVYIAF